MMTSPPPPRRATYRLQLNAGFGFDAAAGVAPYLDALGVSHLYSSPWLQAAPGSTHGYDVVDHGRVSEDLGGSGGHTRLVRELERLGIGVLLDIVPNHMAIGGRANAWWWDVLENGPASLYAGYFDVDWDPPDSKLRNRVLLPVLPDHYGRVLEAGELGVRRAGNGLVVTYADHEMPVAPTSMGLVLAAALQPLPDGSPARVALEELLADVGRLPPSWFSDEEQALERHRAKEAFLRRFGERCGADAEVAAAVDAAVAAIGASPDRFDALLESQNYRLAWWRTGSDELDYRRFFDISTLVGVRQEDPRVFLDSHQLVLAWLSHGTIDGTRVDHVDGLRDPKGYLDRLARAAPERWVVVEKILARGERVPVDWPVAGTTGYEWLNLVGGLFVDPEGETPLSKAYADFTGETTPWDDLEYAAKLEVVRDQFVADLRRLTGTLVTVCEAHRRYRDYASRELVHTLEVVLACFPVYRTYSRVGAPTSAPDREVVARALATARAREDLDPDLLAFIGSMLLLEAPGAAETEFALRFQQLSSAVTAKGVEDTAFYRYLRLSSLNEVGGDPSRFGTGVEEFHALAHAAQVEHPYGLLATSTHDTKRSEDVRARLAVLSEVPAAWGVEVQQWARAAARHKAHGWPDANAEWLWYQTLVGAWPLTADRATAYMEKATKEAGVHTAWTRPDQAYDDALRGFVEGCLADSDMLVSVRAFVDSIARPGWLNSLAQKLLTLTAPGVPDIYQGTELWDFSLVDPDNRRPVDFRARERALEQVGRAPWDATLADGLPKLTVVARALAARRAHPACFGDGPAGRYEPLTATGPAAEHVVAFARGGHAVTVVPRLLVGLARRGGWGSTAVTLPPGSWRDQFSGARLEGTAPLAELLAPFPVALLVREG
jgi:(1->4)-alpha-D-glucan 1-alpha-D-glucosylmutase